MPDYADLVGAAQQKFLPSGVTERTDVWHDRNWLMANLARNRHDPIRYQSEVALRQLDRQEALSQRGQALGLKAADMQVHALEFEANQRRLMAHDSATEAAHQLTTDRNTEIDEQGHGLLQSMLQLDGSLRRGEITKDQYDSGLLEAGQKFPLGTRHPEAAKHYNFAVEEADKQNDFRARQEFREASRLGARYGIGVQADPETGLPSVEHTRLAALRTPKGQTEALHTLNQSILGRYGVSLPAVFENAAGGRMDNQSDPKTFKQTDPNDAQNPQTHVRMQVLSPTGTQHDVIMAKPRFDAIKAEFEPAYQQIISAAPSAANQPAGAATPGAQPAAPAASQFQAGQRYRDAQGNEAVHQADGTWMPVTK